MMLMEGNKHCIPVLGGQAAINASARLGADLAAAYTAPGALIQTEPLLTDHVTGLSAAAVAASASLQAAAAQFTQPVNNKLECQSPVPVRLCGKNRTNLIVNYLPQNMSQDEVRSLFVGFGEIESCKLIRDKASGQSLGYAFVNYKNEDDASKAVNSLNGLHLQNKIIKVSLARPSSDAIKGANLYISGIPKSWSQLDLETLFSQTGHIITSRILCDHITGISKGVAFIRYNQKHEAEAAIKKWNGLVPTGCSEPINVKFASAPTSTKAGLTGAGLGLYGSRRLIGGPLHTFGTRYSGIVRYTPIEAAPALPTATPTILSPMITPAISVGPAAVPGLAPAATAIPTTQLPSISSGSPPGNNWSIFVYNLAPETDESILWQLFGPFGAVHSAKVVKDAQTSKCKGFGFVTMSNYEEAALAISSLNGFTLGNRVLQVSFKASHQK